MKKRNILVMLLLSFVTCGIYAIYWTCSFQGELKKKTGKGFGWVGHLLLSIFTFGIYAIYWQFAAGKRLAQLGADDYAILYIILALIGIGGLINPLLMQHQANNL